MAATGGKAPDAFRTISEVGEDLGLPQHVLRFWETRFPAIRPLKRGGGRRYYRPDDVDLLKGIRALLYDQGYTIKGVQRIIRDSGPRAVGAIGRGEAAPPGKMPAERHDGEEDGPNAGPDGAPPIPGDPVERLRAVLVELGECRRILRALRSNDEG